MNRLVFDVTQLAEWQGRLTGIPRVMNELASRFAPAPATFVVWNGGTFTEVTYDDIMRQRAQVSAPQPAQTGLKAFVKKAEARSRLARVGLRYPRAILHKLRQSPQTPAAPSFDLQKNDTLVVLWGAWHDQTYIDYLVAQRSNGVALVQLAYDMLPLVTPQYSGHATAWLGNYATAIYPLCQQIIAISQHTKQDVTQWLKSKKLRVPPINVVRLGDDFAFSKPVKPQAKLPQQFLLMVGTIEARKNHTLLYYAYKLAAQRGIALPPLVIVGRRGWLTDDIYTLITADPQIKSKFILLEQATDEELSWLYSHCLCSVYASFYEGWGLPIAESIARGVPCVASNTSSMPEIAGNLITYFSPFSSDECLQALVNMLTPGAAAAAKKRLAKYKPTTWDDTYHQVASFIRSTHAKNN